jgi:BASS family bile acid:Na+ symporter
MVVGGPMERIDQADFHFDPKVGLILGLMVAVMVFAVALDLRWDQFRRVLRVPKAPIIGLIAQLVILPAVAFFIGRYMVHTPSVALGLLLVAACPGGSVSNYLTSLAKGDVATSVTITAVITVTSILTTPMLFTGLASANPTTLHLLKTIGINPGELAAMFLVTVAIPIAGGMLLTARRPALAARIRVWARRISMVLFVLVVTVGTLANLGLMLDYAREAVVPVAIACAAALVVGWGLARLVGLNAADRRAVTIEAGGQQVGLAIGIAVAFFPSLAGVAVTGAIWGAVQVCLIVPLVALWSRMPPADAAPAAAGDTATAPAVD